MPRKKGKYLQNDKNKHSGIKVTFEGDFNSINI